MLCWPQVSEILITCHMSCATMVHMWSWFNGYNWIAISRFWHSCCIGFFASPCCDSRNFNMELGQRSRSDLYSMDAIKSQFHLSRNQHYCCIVYLPYPKRDPRNSDMDWNQRPIFNLDLTTQIKSQFHLLRFREVREHRSFESPVSDLTIYPHVSCL